MEIHRLLVSDGGSRAVRKKSVGFDPDLLLGVFRAGGQDMWTRGVDLQANHRAEMALKRPVLEAFSTAFFSNDTPRRRAFEDHLAKHPELEAYARFRAVQESQQTLWDQWPARLRDGEIAHSAGYGYANLAEEIPITPDSTFRLASVSKQFAAMAVMILAERGALDASSLCRPGSQPRRP